MCRVSQECDSSISPALECRHIEEWPIPDIGSFRQESHGIWVEFFELLHHVRFQGGRRPLCSVLATTPAIRISTECIPFFCSDASSLTTMAQFKSVPSRQAYIIILLTPVLQNWNSPEFLTNRAVCGSSKRTEVGIRKR